MGGRCPRRRGVVLGAAALSYALLLGYAAFTVTLMALLLAISRRTLEPLLRLAVIAVISGAIALVGWAPYLLAAAKGTPADKGTAQHYLPNDAAVLTFPDVPDHPAGGVVPARHRVLVMYARSSTRPAMSACATRMQPQH